MNVNLHLSGHIYTRGACTSTSVGGSGKQHGVIGCGHGVLPVVALLPLAGSILLSLGAAAAPDRAEVSDEEAAEEGPARPKPKRKPAAANGEAARPKKARRERADGAPANPNGFTRKNAVTPELAAWLGRASISRPDLTKFFWAYVKERGLQARSSFLREF